MFAEVWESLEIQPRGLKRGAWATKYSFQSAVLSSLLHHHPTVDNSCNRTIATDSVLYRTLRWFSSTRSRRIHRRRTAGHLLQLSRPENPNFLQSDKTDNDYWPKLKCKKRKEGSHTPLRLEVMATMGLHVLVCGLYRSALDNSMQSSRPPTAYIKLLNTAQPRCLRLVDIGETCDHLFCRGSYRSTVVNGDWPSDPPIAYKYPPRTATATPNRLVVIGDTFDHLFSFGSYLKQ